MIGRFTWYVRGTWATLLAVREEHVPVGIGVDRALHHGRSRAERVPPR
jgi:hypothetical protein